MKKMIIMSMAAVIFASQIGLALAMFDGNSRKGRFLFRQECRPCHMENPIGPVPAHYLGPDAKRQAEWAQVFEGRTELPCYEHWQGVTAEDLNDIFTYLYDGAADSPTPQKCG